MENDQTKQINFSNELYSHMWKQIYCLNSTIATHLLYHVHVCCNDGINVNYLISFHLVINIYIELMVDGPIKYLSLN